MLLRLNLIISANWFTHLRVNKELMMKITMLSLKCGYVCITISGMLCFVTQYQMSGVHVRRLTIT